jgi:hypothetical protein
MRIEPVEGTRTASQPLHPEAQGGRPVRDEADGPAYGEALTLTPGFIGIVTSDMTTSLAFYRAVGVGIDAGQDDRPHVDSTLAASSRADGARAWPR